MSKKIVGDDGKTYVQKKPIYKRVWFWLLVIIIIGAFGGGLNGSDKKSATSSSSEKVSESSQRTSSSSEEKSSSSSSSEKPKVSAEFKSALASAKTYATMMHMSKAGVYEQLTADAGDKFTQDEANYAIQHLNDN
ncbi:Ltp family lipoprotein [Leuconostoc pseudomesenteroides]|uniref:Ltp family lipoprotein n=1 Tax=Leuconostoc pseudomesenteroides TaxID=33968 RepID=UPI0039EBCDFE